MSQENVELARWAFTSGDPTRFFSLLVEEVEFDARRQAELPGAVLAGRGREVVEQYCREYWGTWAEYSAHPHGFLDAGDDVIVEVRERGKGKGSGVPFEGTHVQVWTLRGGKIVRWLLFADKADALEAVGLSE
ncbi:MAG TPA: nuclear transport factor 2 family protein [Thermoleophilaceae bacterium]|nr:nuclear transport factor 2 family protein [Thermoleophilaceae bacterium]